MTNPNGVFLVKYILDAKFSCVCSRECMDKTQRTSLDFLKLASLFSHGVPQCFILGPLILFIFINNFFKAFLFFKYTFCADDSTLPTCIPSNAINEINVTINKELDHVNKLLTAIQNRNNGKKRTIYYHLIGVKFVN